MHTDDVSKTVDAFVAHVNAGDLNAAMQHYDPDAAFVPEPGSVVAGAPAVRAAVAQLIDSGAQIQTRERTVLRAQDLALYHSSWALLVDGLVVEEAQSSDVLRLGADGSWRIAIDNPWGAAHLLAIAAARKGAAQA